MVNIGIAQMTAAYRAINNSNGNVEFRFITGYWQPIDLTETRCSIVQLSKMTTESELAMEFTKTVYDVASAKSNYLELIDTMGGFIMTLKPGVGCFVLS
jgi:hypothetical protein